MSTPYTKGFNDGYLIAGHLPEIAAGLTKIGVASPWAEGFRDGCAQYVFDAGRLDYTHLFDIISDRRPFIALDDDLTRSDDGDERDTELES